MARDPPFILKYLSEFTQSSQALVRANFLKLEKFYQRQVIYSVSPHAVCKLWEVDHCILSDDINDKMRKSKEYTPFSQIFIIDFVSLYLGTSHNLWYL